VFLCSFMATYASAAGRSTSVLMIRAGSRIRTRLDGLTCGTKDMRLFGNLGPNPPANFQPKIR
jgi:hypothetical protein